MSYDPAALREFFRAYWPHRYTHIGRAMLKRIILAMKENRV